MKKLLMALVALLPLSAGLMAQNLETLDSIVVSSSRVTAKSPAAFTEMDREQFSLQNPSSSLVMMLNLQPSVVTTNEGGTGLGYSKMRVRGSDPTRMNVTLNGITYNDAESQEVFWVTVVYAEFSPAAARRGKFHQRGGGIR